MHDLSGREGARGVHGDTSAGCLSRFCAPFRCLPLFCAATAACTGGAFDFLQPCMFACWERLRSTFVANFTSAIGIADSQWSLTVLQRHRPCPPSASPSHGRAQRSLLQSHAQKQTHPWLDSRKDVVVPSQTTSEQPTEPE